MLRFVSRVLEHAGFRALAANDASEAISLAATHRIDVLVTDLMMPNINGDDLARRLRATEPDLPVLYLTAFSDRLFSDRMQLWAHEAFLDKPCTVKGLLEAVASVTEGHTEAARRDRDSEDDELPDEGWLFHVRRFISSALMTIAGMALSMLVLLYVDGAPSETTVALGLAAGMVIGHGVWRAARS